jgi:4-hydroxybenzoate polyprenyltransferase
MRRVSRLRTGSSARRGVAGWASLLRVRAWAHFCLLPFASLELERPIETTVSSLLSGVLIAFAILAFGYLLNAVADRRMDRGAKNVFGGEPPGADVSVALVVLAALAVGLSLLGPWTVLVATLVCLASGVLYSVGPRLKRVPLVGTLANVTSFAPLLYVGAVESADASSASALAVAFSALLVENQLLHEAADREEDERGRVATTFRVFGRKGAAVFATLFGALASFVPSASGGLSFLAVPFALVFAIAFPLALFLRGADAPLMARARLAHRYAAFVAGAVLFVGTRLAG